ncbi:hypothetical protein J7L05_08925 [bacterium]|nr:hypothetical protein [bacterium]
MKNDGHLDRNYLKGIEGDKINAVLCGCGQNMRKLLASLSFLRFFSPVFTSLEPAFWFIKNVGQVFECIHNILRKSNWKSKPILNCS